MVAADSSGRRLVVIGATLDPSTLDAVGALEAMVAAGAEVHSIGGARPDVSWLASHQPCDLDDPTALGPAIARVGALIDAVHVMTPLAPAVRAAVVDAIAGLGRSGPVPLVAGGSPRRDV